MHRKLMIETVSAAAFANAREKQMANLSHETTELTPRRGFFGRLAAGVMAIGLAGLVPRPLRAEHEATLPDGPDWPGMLKGRHRQVVDAYAPNDGFPLGFVYTFMATNEPNGTSSATAVLVLRHTAFPIALGHDMWQKYKIGQALNILDPETKAPAAKNPFLHPKPGALVVDDMAIDRLLAVGTVVGACNIALEKLSAKLAGNAGVSAEDAAKEWAANVVPGITIIPSGTWGVNRAQERGCTYCAGG
jgi:hypothetical protein